MTRLIIISIGITLMTTLAFIAQAGTRISESFHHPLGSIPEGWTAVKTGPDAAAEVSPPILPVMIERNGLAIQRTGRSSHNAAIYFTGTRGAVEDGRITDLTATIIMTMQGSGGSSSSGVVLRAQDPDYNDFTGYFVCAGGSGSDKGISIFRNPQTHVHFPDQAIAFTPVPDMASGASYLFRISARGETITASLWTLDDVGNAKEKIGEVEITDAEHVEPGLFGLRGAYGNSGPIGVWFRDLHLEAMR